MHTLYVIRMLLIQVTELFPTSIRNTAMGAVSMASRVGGFLAPYLANLGPEYW
jgi:hypothetical protein